MAATNEDLEVAVRQGRFREDLYYRLKVFPIRIPPLRERRDDIPLLIEALLQRFVQRHGRNVKGVTPRGVHALLRHPWPGNVRELENVLERGLILADESGWIDVQHLFDNHELRLLDRDDTPASPLPSRLTPEPAAPADAGHWLAALTRQQLTLPQLEASLLREALAQCNGNVSATARLLGLSRAQVDYRLRTLRDGERSTALPAA